MKSIKGITLIALVITIVVLLILGSIATYSGISVINSSKLTAFTTEMKIMQTQVNDYYQRFKSGEIDPATIGKEITGSSQVSDQANRIFTSETSGITDQTGYRFWDEATIQELKIEGIEQEFFVNIEKRSIVSYQGLEYKGKTYYTVEQLPDGLYNVDYENKNQGKPTFDVKIESMNTDKWKITVSNIQYSGYIDKWQVKYHLDGKEYWNTSDDLSFVVNEEGKYAIKIANGEIESDIIEKLIADSYLKNGLILHYDAINNTGEGDSKHSDSTTTWKDLSGKGNDGTLTGFDNTIDSKWENNSLKFNGINNIVETNGKEDFSKYKAGTSFSYAATFKTNKVTTSWYGVMSNMEAWGNGGFNIQYGLAQKIALSVGEYLNSTTIPQESTTYTVYGVYDGKKLYLYVNGKKEAEKEYAITAGKPTIKIGCFYTTPSLLTDARVYNVLFYNRALSENEIAYNYQLDQERFK